MPKQIKRTASRSNVQQLAKPLMLVLASFLLAAGVMARAQQNPSPMVEHTREHPRLQKTAPSGQRIQLELGTLFVPESVKQKRQVKLLLFFHGGDWLPEFAVAQQRNMAVISVQAGAGSSSYEKLFADPARLPRLIAEAEGKSGRRFGEIDLGGWSAGCGALRKILNDQPSYDRVSRVLCIDGVHTGYVNGKPGPEESEIETDNLQIWLRLGRDAIAGKKRLIVTHTEIFPAPLPAPRKPLIICCAPGGWPRIRWCGGGL